MTLEDWLREEKGRLTTMAEHFGVTKSAISQWQRNGVPKRWMKAVREYTEGAVTLEEMVPG